MRVGWGAVRVGGGKRGFIKYSKSVTAKIPLKVIKGSGFTFRGSNSFLSPFS